MFGIGKGLPPPAGAADRVDDNSSEIKLFAGQSHCWPVPCIVLCRHIAWDENMWRNKTYLLAAGILILACMLILLSGHGLFLINLPGLIIVLGGTFLASIIGHSPERVIGLLKRVPMLIKTPMQIGFPDYKGFLLVANCYRRGDIRRAEQAGAALQDPFLREGARLALDPHNGEDLERMLQWRIRRVKDQDAGEVRILRTMAGFAPAFGMLGSLFGLISLMDELGSSGLGEIGIAMGFALMSTLYGLLLANLLLRPLATKLEEGSRERLTHMGYLLDALVMLYERRHPVQIAEYLDSAAEPAPPQAAMPRPDNVSRLAIGRAQA